jgi:hypothetical protein
MASKSSKVLGVRVPLDEYITLLQKASENNMTISDFALKLIYLYKDKKPDIIEQELQVMTKRCNLFEEQRDEFEEKLSAMEKHLNAFKIANKYNSEKATLLDNIVNDVIELKKRSKKTALSIDDYKSFVGGVMMFTDHLIKLKEKEQKAENK